MKVGYCLERMRGEVREKVIEVKELGTSEKSKGHGGQRRGREGKWSLM